MPLRPNAERQGEHYEVDGKTYYLYSSNRDKQNHGAIDMNGRGTAIAESTIASKGKKLKKPHGKEKCNCFRKAMERT